MTEVNAQILNLFGVMIGICIPLGYLIFIGTYLCPTQYSCASSAFEQMSCPFFYLTIGIGVLGFIIYMLDRKVRE